MSRGRSGRPLRILDSRVHFLNPFAPLTISRRTLQDNGMRFLPLRIVTVGLVAAGVTALVWAQAGRALVINGKTAPAGSVVTQGGQAFVSVAALRAAGAEVTADANRITIQFAPLRERLQTDAVEGTLGEWVQNETWRVRVSDVQPIKNPFGRGPGFSVNLEMRNLQRQQATPYSSGLQSVQLIDSKGNVLTFSPGSFRDQFKSLAQAQGISNVLQFGDDNNQLTEVGEPDRMLLLFRTTGGKRLRDIRIFLRPQGVGG